MGKKQQNARKNKVKKQQEARKRLEEAREQGPTMVAALVLFVGNSFIRQVTQMRSGLCEEVSPFELNNDEKLAVRVFEQAAKFMEVSPRALDTHEKVMEMLRHAKAKMKFEEELQSILGTVAFNHFSKKCSEPDLLKRFL